MGLSKISLAFLGSAVVVASGVGWFAWHERAMGDTPGSAAAPAVATPTATSSLAPSPAPASIVPKRTIARRFDSPAARERLLRQVQQRRVPTHAAPLSRSASGTAPGAAVEDLDKRYVRDAVQAILPMLTECYTSALERQPQLAGRLVVDFTIEGDPDLGGLVTESAINPDSDIPEPAFRECVQETMFAIEIDPPTNGGTVRVTYPFEFHP